MLSKNDPADRIILDAIESGKAFTLGLYLSGSRRDQSDEEADALQAEHLRYLFRLRQSGVLVMNGPVTDDGNLRGILILNTTDTAEAARLIEEDPAVRAGRLIYEIHPWFGLPGDALPG